MTVADCEVILGLDRFGDAVYFVDRDMFSANIERFRSAFRDHYSHANLGYSVKTNYLPFFCQTAHALGCYSEVVSEMEYALVRALGVPGDRIIVNGPHKPASFLRRALEDHAIVNIDGNEELSTIEELANQTRSSSATSGSRRPWRLGLRCNVRIARRRVSRFGFDAEGDAFRLVVERARRVPGAELVALHAHICTQKRSIAEYEELVDRLIAVADEVCGSEGPRMLNLGGGFFSEMPPGMRMDTETHIPTFEEYGAALGEKMARRYGTAAPGPELVLEPGLAILATSMHFACEVVGIKTLGERTIVTTSGSVYNITPTKSRRKPPMRVIHRGRKPPVTCRKADIVGHTCMEDDVLHEGYHGKVAIGDALVFDNVGAYTVVLKPPFIKTCPSVVAYDETTATFSILKRQETNEDIFATFIMNAQAALYQNSEGPNYIS